MTTPAHDDLSVQGVKPGQTRGEVLSLLGPPLGDGFREDLPRVLRPPLAQAPVWRYDEIAVFFEEDRVWQVCGPRLQANGEDFLHRESDLGRTLGWSEDRVRWGVLKGDITLYFGAVVLLFFGPYSVHLKNQPVTTPAKLNLVATTAE